MKRNNNKRSNAKKERVIMIASSVFVLTALTMTGIYMKSTSHDNEDNGYTIDFSALENSANDKLQEIAQNNPTDDNEGIEIADISMIGQQNHEDNPVEAGSGMVEIPGLTDKDVVQDQAPSESEIVLPRETVAPPAPTQTPTPEREPEVSQEQTPTEEPEGREPENKEPESREPERPEKVTATEGTTVVRTLQFAESDGLRRPLEGEVLMPFSMNGSIYFSTLKDYRYNPALMIEAAPGTPVTACADGKVIAIFENEEIGHAVTLDIGNGYQLTYGQLEAINVSLNSYVNEGEQIGVVAAPTKYFSVEGSNLYLKMIRGDQSPVDPEMLFR